MWTCPNHIWNVANQWCFSFTRPLSSSILSVIFFSWRCQIFCRWMFFFTSGMHLHERNHDIVKLFVKRWSFPASFWALVWIRESQFLSDNAQFIIIVMIKWLFFKSVIVVFLIQRIYSRPSSEISSRDHRVPIEMTTYNGKSSLEIYPRVRSWSHDFDAFISNLWPPDTWERTIPSVVLCITLWAYSSMSRPILQQCLWSILPSCACLASCLLPLSLSSYSMKSFRTFRGLHQSDRLSWSNFSVPVINGLFSKFYLSSTFQKINWNTHMLFDSRMICYSNLRDAAHTVSEHIERGPFFGKNRMTRDLLLAITGIDVSSWTETLTSIFFFYRFFLFEPVW